MRELSVEELKAELDKGKAIRLLDVREPEELAISALPGVLAIPMGEVPSRLGEIDPELDWVVICRSGGRSGNITQHLESRGYTKVRNLVGGMRAWAERIQPGMPVG